MLKLDRPDLSSDMQASLDRAAASGMDWDSYDKKDVRAVLRKMQFGLCAYCEGRLSPHDGHTRIDHFVPQSAGVQHVFDWSNLFLSCDCLETCDNAKHDSVDALIKPDVEDPLKFLAYTSTGEIRSNPANSETDRVRAENTIRVLNLDDWRLVCRRTTRCGQFLKYLRTLQDPECVPRYLEYRSFLQFMVRHHQQTRTTQRFAKDS